ncbi:MAG: acylphosphatase [Streptococcaceae bacterium]|jgi:acylphosphatase|nr:acylphosphatase [Streptococcaceae bacterium]
MQKVAIVVSGQVQGVGFRYHTLMLANELGVKGQVWNNNDGTVGILAQADSQTLLSFQKSLRSGSRWIRVNYMDVEPANFEDFKDFKISYK